MNLPPKEQVELKDTKAWFSTPEMVYTADMAVLDDNTHYVSGAGGPVNNMLLGETKNGRTTVSFVHYTKVSGDHVDEADIVGQILFSNIDLVNFSKLLADRVKEL